MTDKQLLKIALDRIKEMGRIIRGLDEDSVYSENWLMDEDYVPGTEEIENAIKQ